MKKPQKKSFLPALNEMLPNWFTGADVREIQGPVYIPPAGKAGGYRKELAADIARKTGDPFTQRDIQSAVIAGADVVPLMGEDVGIKETGEYWKKGDYINAAASGLGTVLGVAPVVGDVGGKLIKEGGKKLARGLGATNLAPAKQFLDRYKSPSGVNVEVGEYLDAPDIVGIANIERTTGPKGAGAEAMRELTRQADEAGTKVRLTVEKDNIKKLAPYYRQFGFRTIEKRDGDLLMQRQPQSFKRDDDLPEPGGLLKGIRAYHGSPHSFEEFDISKIGTGEGAQAYGHGLYFAENEAVARDYRNKLADRPKVLAGGEEITPTTSLGIFNKTDADATVAGRLSSWAKAQTVTGGKQASAADAIAKVRADLDRGMELAQQNGNFDLWSKLNDQKLSLQRMEERGLDLQHGGHMYEVDIAADPEAFLDWDKPLSEQSASVRARMEASVGAHPRVMSDLEATSPQDVMRQISHQTGGEIHMGLGDVFGGTRDLAGGAYSVPFTNEPAVSELLREAGIPGIRYLDQGSRVAAAQAKLANYEKMVERRPGSSPIMQQEIARLKDEVAKAKANETRNYVVFDPKIINIVKKYGLAGALAAGLISQDQAEAMERQGLGGEAEAAPAPEGLSIDNPFGSAPPRSPVAALDERVMDEAYTTRQSPRDVLKRLLGLQ